MSELVIFLVFFALGAYFAFGIFIIIMLIIILKHFLDD